MPSGAGTAAWPRSKAVPSPWLHPARTPRRSEPPASGCSERRGRTGAWSPTIGGASRRGCPAPAPPRPPPPPPPPPPRPLQADKILRPTGPPLHRHEVVQAGNHDGHAIHRDLDRVRPERLERHAWIGIAKQVQDAGDRRQREHVPGEQGTGVEGYRGELERASTDRPQLSQDRGQALEVLGAPLATDVEVGRQGG